MEIKDFIAACKIEEISNANNNSLTKEYKVSLNKEAQKKLITHIIKNSISSNEKPQKGFRKTSLLENLSEEYIENYSAQKFNDKLTIKEKLIQESIQDLIDLVAKKYEGQDITPPEYELESSDDQYDLYKVTLDLFPTIKDINLDNLPIDKIDYEITDEEIEKEIERLLAETEYLAKAPEEKIISENDTIIIDFLGFVRKGKKKLNFEGGQAKNYQIELGKNKMLPEFEAALINMKLNEEKNFPLRFPENYQGGLGGVLVEFDVKIGSILEKRKFENIEEYLKENKIESLENLKENIKASLAAEIDEKIKIINKDQIFEALEKAYPDLEIPQSLYKRELEIAEKSYKDKQAQDLAKSESESEEGNKEEKSNEILDEKELADIVKSKVKLMLLLMAIAKNFDIKIAEVDLLIELFSLAKKMNIPYETLMNYYRSDARALENLKQQALEGKIIKFIFEKATKEEKKHSKEEINDLYKKVMED